MELVAAVIPGTSFVPDEKLVRLSTCEYPCEPENKKNEIEDVSNKRKEFLCQSIMLFISCLSFLYLQIAFCSEGFSADRAAKRTVSCMSSHVYL